MAARRPGSRIWKRTPREEKILARLRRLCGGLEGAEEGLAWGQPTFRVGGKIFASFAPGHGFLHIAFQAPDRTVLKDPKVAPAGPWAKWGWVLLNVEEDPLDWGRIESYVTGSHELVRSRLPAKKRLR